MTKVAFLFLIVFLILSLLGLNKQRLILKTVRWFYLRLYEIDMLSENILGISNWLLKNMV